MKFSTTLLAAGIVALGATAYTANADAEAEAGLDVASAYIFRGATVSDEVSVQPFLEGTFSGVTVGTWGNFNTDASQLDEIDYYASYDIPLGEDVPVGLSVGYCEYTYPTAVDEAGAGLEADREVSLSASLGDVIFAPSITANIGIEGPFLDQGIYIELAGGHDIEIDEGLTISTGVTVGYEAGDNVAETGFSHVTLSAGTSFGPVSLGLNYVVETDDTVLAVDEDFYGSLSVGLPL